MSKKEVLFSYLEQGITQFHLIEKIKGIYDANGFKMLDVKKEFGVLEPGTYYVQPYMSCLFAFRIGINAKSVRITACHSDFPMLKLKSNPDMDRKGHLTVNTEPYGGIISSTWFDRPLGLAGKLVKKGESIFEPKAELYDSKKPLFMIPSLAPHLKSDSQDKKIDIAKELVPVAGLYDKDKKLNMELGFEDVIASDLYLYNMDKPIVYGVRDEFMASPRIDNISSAAAITEALAYGETNEDTIAVGAYFDNEEIGSQSKQGADSTLLRDLIDRIILAACPEKKEVLLSNSFIASLDVAHALHPNYPEKSDPTNEVKLGGGVVVKQSASQRYVSDSEATAVIVQLAEKYDIKIQKQTNKSGMPGGKTLGPIISGHIPAMACDMGIPVLAMHSANETACLKDYEALEKLVKVIYQE